MQSSNLKIFLLFITVIYSNLVTAQSKDTIYWSESRKLNWEDFKGKPDKTTNLIAMTQAGIGYEVVCKNAELNVKIYCYFNVNKSWTKETDSYNLLRHEQLHFDITELYARKLRKKISELNDPCGKNINELEKIYNSNFNEYSREQDAYDKQSNHSLNKEGQKQWEEKIALELNALEKFACIIIEED